MAFVYTGNGRKLKLNIYNLIY